MRRDIDQSGLMDAVDRFELQAMNLLTSPAALQAFELNREPDAVRDWYGRNQWGQQCLLARRLVEAGVEIVTTEFDGPLCGRVSNWDDHAVNHHVFNALAYRAPFVDQAVSALIEDVYQRGLDKRVLVIVTGEFRPHAPHLACREQRLRHCQCAGGNCPARRDHWPQAGSMLFAGGGIHTGQVVGATDTRGEAPIARRVGPEDFLATIYQHLAIDFRRVAIRDFSGRPTPIIRQAHRLSSLGRQLRRHALLKRSTIKGQTARFEDGLLHLKIVRVRDVGLFFSPHDPGEIGHVGHVPVKIAELHLLIASPVFASRCREGESGRRSVKRLDLKRPLGPANDKCRRANPSTSSALDFTLAIALG